MSKSVRKSLTSVLASAALLFSLGCGSTTNNDQGTSFLAFGWSDLSDTPPTPNVSGVSVALATDAPQLTTASGLALEGSMFTVGIALQNRLTTQFIRLDRIDCAYNIEGSDISIPNESVNVSAVLGPTAEDGTTTSSANNGLVTEFGNSVYTGFPVLTTDIISYLNVNKNSLPQLPFRMIARCHAIGVTQAGDVLTTNDLYFPVYFFDTAECCTGATGETPGTSGGFQGGAANGGDITFEDGTTASDTLGGTTAASTTATATE